MPTQSDIRKSITDSILTALASGTAPWRKPWSSNGCSGSPKNAVSQRSYSGINILLLAIAAEQQNLRSRFWATYRQWQSLGCQVKAGSKGTQVIFCKPCTKTVERDGVECEDKFFLLKTFYVFNADSCEGESAERYRAIQQPVGEHEIDQRHQQAEEAIVATGADIRYYGDRAAYYPEHDYIQMPSRSRFESPEAFYSVALHELAHWAEKRIGWDRKKPENTYALGELIAEISGCFTCAELGLPVEQSLGNHASYLQHWIDQMREDHRFIFRATAQASKATDFILSFSRQPEAELEPEEVLAA